MGTSSPGCLGPDSASSPPGLLLWEATTHPLTASVQPSWPSIPLLQPGPKCLQPLPYVSGSEGSSCPLCPSYTEHSSILPNPLLLSPYLEHLLSLLPQYLTFSAQGASCKHLQVSTKARGAWELTEPSVPASDQWELDICPTSCL